MTAQPDVVEQLTKLASLRDAGILTDEEFARKKAQLLERL
ncbi:SHOCT domain-containing protein [Actinoplanes octamycinicus]